MSSGGLSSGRGEGVSHTCRVQHPPQRPFVFFTTVARVHVLRALGHPATAATVNIEIKTQINACFMMFSFLNDGAVSAVHWS